MKHTTTVVCDHFGLTGIVFVLFSPAAELLHRSMLGLCRLSIVKKQPCRMMTVLIHVAHSKPCLGDETFVAQ